MKEISTQEQLAKIDKKLIWIIIMLIIILMVLGA